MRKRLLSFLVCLLLLLSLSGCRVEETPASLGSTVTIPQDGMISAETFRQMKEENKVVTFVGTSGDAEYQWTVFGNEIEEERNQDFLVNITAQGQGTYLIRPSASVEFSMKLLLSVSLEYEDADAKLHIYRKTNTLLEELEDCNVSRSGKKYVIHLQIKDGTQFVVRFDQNTDDETASEPVEEVFPTATQDPYVTIPKSEATGTITTTAKQQNLSDGTQNGKDQYETDPVPAGKPLPVEPENQSVNQQKVLNCTFSIECSSILNHLSDLKEEKLDVLPSNGVILERMTVEFYEGESVFDVLKRICSKKQIHLESSWTPLYNSAYIEGIHNLYEFDCGSGSGWMYRVNGWYPNYGCSRFELQDGDVVEWRYTCELGDDIGGGYALGSD